MNDFIKAVRRLVIAICLALFSVGIIWNLFYGTLPKEQVSQPTMGEVATDTKAQEQQYVAEKMQAANKTVRETETSATEVGLFPVKQTAETKQDETKTLDNRLAALRMERDSSWQQLKEGLEGLQFAQKQECLKQYEELQYKEQRLELLLKAKGIEDCLVLLEEQQANVIAGGADAEMQYQKIYDLVQRNTNYGPEQIVVIPLTAETSLPRES